MSKLQNVALIALAVSTLAGCGLLGEKSKDELFGDFAIDQLSKKSIQDISNCANTGTADNDDSCVSRYATLAIEESNEKCTDHLKTIYGNDAAFNISTGTLATFTAGWAAISSGGQAKLLAATSAFASGERALVNETIYKNQVTPYIGIKIAQMRDEKGLALRGRLATKDYTAALAVFDIEDYHNACSFYVGLQKALQEGTNASPEMKLAQLEKEHSNLISQIYMYSATRNNLPSNDKSKEFDAALKTLSDRLENISKKIAELNRSK